MKPHHLGYLVRDLDLALQEFEFLGYTRISPAVIDRARGCTICFVENDWIKAELVQPLGEDSPLWGLLRKFGASPYHICYQAEDLEGECRRLRERGYVPMGEPLEAPALSGVFAAFFFHREVGIVELIPPSGGEA